jgi:hypothetical protein
MAENLFIARSEVARWPTSPCHNGRKNSYLVDCKSVALLTTVCTTGCTAVCTAGCTEHCAPPLNGCINLRALASYVALIPEKEAPKRQMHSTSACMPPELRVMLVEQPAGEQEAPQKAKRKKKRVRQPNKIRCLFVSQREKRSKRGAAFCRWLPRRPAGRALSHLGVQESSPGPVASQRRRRLPREERAKNPRAICRSHGSENKPVSREGTGGRRTSRPQKGFGRVMKRIMCATEGTNMKINRKRGMMLGRELKNPVPPSTTGCARKKLHGRLLPNSSSEHHQNLSFPFLYQTSIRR